MKLSSFRTLLALGVLWSITAPALAAEAEEHSASTFLGVPTVIWVSANLVLFLGLLWGSTWRAPWE